MTYIGDISDTQRYICALATLTDLGDIWRAAMGRLHGD